MIFVAEDNPSDVHLLELALRQAGVEHDLYVCHDGQQALQWIADCGQPGRHCPDLAIIDLNLPKYDGIEILTAMRGKPELHDTPTLVLSSTTSPRDVSRVLAFPHTEYLRKPVELDEYLSLGSVVRGMLSKTRR